MDIVNLMDLSFLTSKEQAIIQEVLKRDAKLKKREEQRIRKIRKKTLDYKSMKLQTGEWFEDLKAKRFLENPSATDHLQIVLHQEAKSGFVQSRTSCLTKIKSLQFLKMFAGSKSTDDLGKRCSNEKNFAIKEECVPSPGLEEQSNVMQILKDLEFILDLELKNSSGDAQISDINGFSPENVIVDKKLPADYSSHQVWRYQVPSIMDTSSGKNTSDSTSSASGSLPGLMNAEIFQPSLSPIKNTNLNSGIGLSAYKYNYLKYGDKEDVHPRVQKINEDKENPSVLLSSEQLEEPFCSSQP